MLGLPPSLHAQCNRRVNLSCAAGRDVAGQYGHAGYHSCDSREGQRICGADSEEQAREEAGKRERRHEAQDRASCHKPQPLAHHQLEDVGLPGAQGRTRTLRNATGPWSPCSSSGPRAISGFFQA